jgi:hypothetical protein
LAHTQPVDRANTHWLAHATRGRGGHNVDVATNGQPGVEHTALISGALLAHSASVTLTLLVRTAMRWPGSCHHRQDSGNAAQLPLVRNVSLARGQVVNSRPHR